MEGIAKEMLKEQGPLQLFSDKNEPIYAGIEGPIVTDRKERIEYTWYKILEWGDTASISAFVYKSVLNEFSGIFRAKNPPSVTADTRWFYVYMPEGISNLKEILPKSRDCNTTDLSALMLCYTHEKMADSIEFIVKPERLLFFLRKGYFHILAKQENNVFIEFYEPIANIVQVNTKDTINTKSAKVSFNESSVVQILPYYENDVHRK